MDYTLPDINSVGNPDSHDYAGKLNAGLVELHRIIFGLLDEEFKNQGNRGKRLKQALEACGLKVEEPKPVLEQSLRIPDGPAFTSILEQVVAETPTRAEKTLYETTRLAFEEGEASAGFETGHRLIEFKQALDDFTDAALKLTQIQPLRKFNPKKHAATYLFALWNGAVYGLTCDLHDLSFSKPVKHENLSPAMFDGDNAAKKKIMSELRKGDLSAYVVSNLCSAVDHMTLIAYSAKVLYRQLIKPAPQESAVLMRDFAKNLAAYGAGSR